MYCRSEHRSCQNEIAQAIKPEIYGRRSAQKESLIKRKRMKVFRRQRTPRIPFQIPARHWLIEIEIGLWYIVIDFRNICSTSIKNQTGKIMFPSHECVTGLVDRSMTRAVSHDTTLTRAR